MTVRARRFGLALFALVGMLTGCETVNVMDGAVQPGLPNAIAIAGSALGLVVLLLFAGSMGRRAIAHHQASRRLLREARPAVLEGHRVQLVPGIGAAVVAGIIRPTVYCADDLAARLDPEELRALLWHEDHHRLTRAPARLVALAGVGRVLGWIPPIEVLIERARAAIEIAADEHAIRAGSSRPALARAIMRLQDYRSGTDVAPFVSAVDLRLGALLGEPRPSSARWTEATISLAAGAVLAITLCSAIVTMVRAG
jgi:beta-lactamase regulating signal transducer with metallopeptidase domain